jgi:hypothetical protein
MAENTPISAGSPAKIHADIVERLRARRAEIEQAIYARIREAVPDPVSERDPAYQTGLHGAIAAIVEYYLEGIERGPEGLGPIPSAATAQARRAARANVSIGTVLRRYVAGHRRLGELVAEEAAQSDMSNDGAALHYLHRTQEALLEHLAAVIEREYHHQRERIAYPLDQRRAEIVQQLLFRDPVDPVELMELDYDLHTSWHLGVIVTGASVEQTLQGLKATFGRKFLYVSGSEGTTWAWVGERRRFTAADVESRLCANRIPGVTLAIGGPGRGIDGWRQTHREAREALPLALRTPEKPVWYADSPLLAAALQNDTLARWLKDSLTPLSNRADGGVGLLQTLRAYIDAECNRSSAASALRLSRHTVESRLRTAERLLGHPLRGCLPELDVALRLRELEDAALEDPSPAR